MKNSIIEIQEIDEYKNYLGNKTLNLKKCLDWGFNVPKFIALPSYVSNDLLMDENFRKRIVQEIINILPNKKYAVRSSALIEDDSGQSYAGQFLTKTNLSEQELDFGIQIILEQAKTYLNGNIDKFSLIIQEYIKPDISGVAFTRNPNGEREMLIEYGFCEGEKIVSGEIKPAKLSFYWSEQAKKLPKPFLQNQIIEKFKELENKSNFPQDIEWCIKGNQFFVLQARPITTISGKQYEQILYLENGLPKNQKFHFAKTEISEIAPRPSAVTYDLLNHIYAKGGPVDKVYKKYKISYKDTKFLKIIGNELFVDKKKEIQGLLPSDSLFNLLIAVNNFYFLNKIKTNNYQKIFDNLKATIEAEYQKNIDLKTTLKKFLNDYELIFATNLLSGLSIKKVNLMLKNEPINFAEILNGSSHFVDLTKYQIEPPKNLTGNSLELLDESNFIANNNLRHNTTDKISNWWQKLSELKKKMLKDRLVEAIIYNHLRELGRWLTVKNINALKTVISNIALECEFKDRTDIFSANFTDLINGNIDENLCQNNKLLYQKYSHFCLPNDITSSLIVKKTKIIGVSAGLASGILQSKEIIEAKNGKNIKYILYTEILSSDLTKYFDQITGIVSNNGGLLSHLAIMARENNIPVIVGFSIKNSDINLGNFIQIDGDNGNIKKIK